MSYKYSIPRHGVMVMEAIFFVQPLLADGLILGPVGVTRSTYPMYADPLDIVVSKRPFRSI